MVLGGLVVLGGVSLLAYGRLASARLTPEVAAG